MIVNQDDCRRSFRYRFSEYFPRMYERRIEKPARYRDVALEPVLRIEHRDVKLFHRQVFEALREYLEHVTRPTHRCSFLSFFRSHASPQLESRMDTNSTSRSYASQAGQGRDGLGRE